jgi:hypothetical protein
MARKKDRGSPPENSIVSQESRIPKIALKAFSNAYKSAKASGEPLLVIKNRQLLQITQDSEKVLRHIEGYGELKRGTLLKIRKVEA